jgi:hypothetical protein
MRIPTASTLGRAATLRVAVSVWVLAAHLLFVESEAGLVAVRAWSVRRAG